MRSSKVAPEPAMMSARRSEAQAERDQAETEAIKRAVCSKGSAPEQRAKRAVEVAKAGAAIIDKLLLVGGAVPILGNVCTTAREIFRNVEQVARKVGDVLEMGERVLEALRLLERMRKNIEMFPVTDELRDGWQSLRDVLWLILDSVETFGRKGWVKRVLNASMKLGSMVALDQRLGKELENLLRLYKMERDGALLEAAAKARTYPFETALVTQVQVHLQAHGGTQEKAMEALAANEQALHDMAQQLDIDSEEIKEEIRELREEVVSMLDEQGNKMDLLLAGQLSMQEIESRIAVQLEQLKARPPTGLDAYEYVRKPSSKANFSDKKAATLGKGSFGTTYQMRKKAGVAQALVAVKVIDEDEIDEASGIATDNLEREAVQLSCLDHPHIVRYIESFWYEAGGDDGRQFVIVTELLSGGTFNDKLRLCSDKPAEAKLRQWTEQIASALAFMHSLKMQHRDLKPDNVLFNQDEQPKIIDLGLACTLASKSRVSTKKGGAVGTNLYMSPEKGSGKSYDGKDDVWALGIMLAGGVIGTPLEDMDGVNAVGIFALNRSGVDKLVKQAQAANASLGKVVEAMLAQNAFSRATAQQVVEALRSPGSAIGPQVGMGELREDEDEESAAAEEAKLAAEKAQKEAEQLREQLNSFKEEKAAKEEADRLREELEAIRPVAAKLKVAP